LRKRRIYGGVEEQVRKQVPCGMMEVGGVILALAVMVPGGSSNQVTK